MRTQSALPDSLHSDDGEQLAADLQALVDRGLIELHRDQDGEWRVALADAPRSA